MMSTKHEYEPSVRSSIASHGNDDLFLLDQPSSVLGLDLSTDPGVYKGPFCSSGWHSSSEPQIQQSPSVSSFVDKDSCSSARSHDRLVEPLDSATSAYFDPRSESEFPASSLPPVILPRSTRERNLKRLSQEIVPQFVVPYDAQPSRPPSRANSAQGSRPPSIVLSRPSSSYRVQPPPSRPPSRRSLAEEIHDVGEEVPRSDLDDDSDDDVSWAAVLGGPSDDLDRFISRNSEQSFERQRAAFPPPRSRTSSISARSIISSRLPSRAPSFSGKSTFSSRSPVSTPPLTPDPTRIRIHAARHSFHIEQLSAGSPSSSLAPPSPLDNGVSPRRSNSIGGLPSLRSLRGFRSNRRSSGKGEPEFANINVPVPGLLTAADLPSPVPELPNEPDTYGSKGSAPSSTHSRDSVIFHSRFGMPPTTPTRSSGKPRMSLPKMPKVFRRSSNSNASPSTLTTIETTDEIAPNGDIIERTFTTTRRPSVGSRRQSFHSNMSQISHPSPRGSTPATPGTPDHYVENSPLAYVANTSRPSSRPSSRPVTPPPRAERMEIKPIMIVDYANYPGTTYTPASPPRAPVRGTTPSRPTAPGPPVRSQPSTPSIVIVKDSTFVPPVPPLPIASPQLVAPVPTQVVVPVPAPAAARAPAAEAPKTPSQAPKATKTHISVGSNASIDITTALSEGPVNGSAPAPATSPIPVLPLAEIVIPAEATAPAREVKVAPPATKASTTIDIEVGKEKVEVATSTAPKEALAAESASKVAETPKAKSVEPAEAAAKSSTTVNIDPKKGTVEVVAAPVPAPVVKAVAPSSPKSVKSTKLAEAKDAKVEEKKKAEEKKVDKPKSSPKPETRAEMAPPVPQSRSRSPSIRSVDARIRRTSGGEEVIVTLQSQRDGDNIVDVPKDKGKQKQASKDKEPEKKAAAEKERVATFSQFDKHPKTPEKKHVRPEHVKHHSVDSLRHGSPHHNQHLHAKQHSLDSPRYSRSVSYDHTHAPSPSHLNVSHSRMSSRRNSLESNASFATIDSRGAPRKRRVLNPMSVDDSDDAGSSDTEGEGENSEEVEYNETADAANVKIKARANRKNDSDEDSDEESLLNHRQVRNEEARMELRKRIQHAQRLMKENPRLPSEIDDVPAHPSFPAGPFHNVPPQHWPRPAPNPGLRPLYLGGRSFGAPVSTGMMPGLGYAAGQLGHGSYLGMPMGPVPMMLGRPPATQPGWYPRPRP